MTSVALLPIKGHSARVPGKNFREFAGKPLFRWILDTLLEVKEIDRIVINTDARSILEAAGLVETNRIFIRDRRPEICGDFVSMNLVIADDLENVSADTYVMTHTTNPLLSASTIRAALRSYEVGVISGVNDSLFTVNRFQTRFYRTDGSPVNHDAANLIRTQDLEPWFEENSNLYVFSRESFTATKARIGKKPILFETPRTESADIDDQEGWSIAEALAKAGLRPET
jgi:CMP-N-acetylneuraminic acid synthetase